jgi:hypothetical protein
MIMAMVFNKAMVYNTAVITTPGLVCQRGFASGLRQTSPLILGTMAQTKMASGEWAVADRRQVYARLPVEPSPAPSPTRGVDRKCASGTPEYAHNWAPANRQSPVEESRYLRMARAESREAPSGW